MKAVKCLSCTIVLISALFSPQVALAEDPPHLANIVITPIEPTLSVGQSVVFTATGYDQYGNPIPIANPVWEADNEFGTVTPDPENPNVATYTAIAAGRGYVMCSEGPIPGGPDWIHGSTDITIEPPIVQLRPVATEEVTPLLPETSPVNCTCPSALLPLAGLIFWYSRRKKA